MWQIVSEVHTSRQWSKGISAAILIRHVLCMCGFRGCTWRGRSCLRCTQVVNDLWAPLWPFVFAMCHVCIMFKDIHDVADRVWGAHELSMILGTHLATSVYAVVYMIPHLRKYVISRTHTATHAATHAATHTATHSIWGNTSCHLIYDMADCVRGAHESSLSKTRPYMMSYISCVIWQMVSEVQTSRQLWAERHPSEKRRGV